tara:strand:- start:1749 stop:2432 length:684 start_codon:yes stop_codon:yes gene_type:complete
MAKKESKSKQHTRNLVAGMKSSNSQSRTPISTLYPKKTTVNTAKSSMLSRSKGTRSPSASQRPQKFLLSVTNPGNAPTAPRSPGASPVALPNPQTQLQSGDLTYESYSGRGWNARAESYRTDQRDLSERTSAYNTNTTAITNWQQALGTYNTNLANYNNTTLPNYTTNKTAYDLGVSKNTKTTNKYNKDVSKFIRGLQGKSNSVANKTAAKMRGARNSNTSLGGSRS